MRRAIPPAEELLSLLVRCPSVNPGRDPVTSATGEARLASLLGDILRPWAEEVTLTEVAPGRSNLAARFPGRDRSRCYAFEAHSDTVAIDGMTIDPFGATIADGRLYGRGACDTKGPMAAMLLAILRHVENCGRPPCDVLFLSTCDEELGGLGARHMVENGLRCEGIVVGEPTGLRLIECHKGAKRFRLAVRGKAAHSAYPELGCNAIHAAADFIRALQDAVARLSESARWTEPGPPTASVGVIRGGDQVNRVPELAILEIDFRIPPGLAPSSVDRLMARATTSTLRRNPRIALKVETTQSYPAFRLDPGNAFHQKLSPLTKEEDTSGTARYATNAGFFASGGIPCIVFGPGSPGDAHTADESISLAEVEEASRRLENFLTAL